MSSIHIKGGIPLSGTIAPSANKNAVLPILCASLLTDKPVVFENVPDITDVHKLLHFFEHIGSKVEFSPDSMTLRMHHQTLTSFNPEEIPSAMRSSILLFGPLLYRLKSFSVHTNTKGCALGVREIDPHLELFRAFGVTISASHERISFSEPIGPITGINHWFDYASVTATETFLMIASFAKGTSTLSNAACEPHVQDLCCFLTQMGAAISGLGSNTLTVTGIGSFSGARFRMPDDYHEVATFLALGAITGGSVFVNHSTHKHLPLINRSFEKLGIEIKHNETSSWTASNLRRPYSVKEPFTQNMFPKVEAAPWPYFPADLLPIFVALATVCNGNVLFWNKVYEGGLSWIPELNKFGAFCHLSDPHKVIVIGNTPLHPAKVEAPYIIRAAIALLMVGLAVDGDSVIHGADPIRRAHPRFIEKLQSLGAQIEWKE